MTLAGKPIDAPVQGDTIELDHMLESQIRPGQPVIVSGTPTDLEDVVESELAIVKEAVNVAGILGLVFESKLQRVYRRDSVTLNANLAPATHGESHKEVLGGGDASQPFQTFSLGHTPLTYLIAPVPRRRPKLAGAQGQRCAVERSRDSLRTRARRSALRIAPRRGGKDDRGIRRRALRWTSAYRFRERLGKLSERTGPRGESCRGQDRAARFATPFRPRRHQSRCLPLEVPIPNPR